MERSGQIVDTEALFGVDHDLRDIRDNSSAYEIYREWPSESGTGHVGVMQLRPGLLISRVSYRLKEYIEIEFKSEFTETDTPLFFGYVQSGSMAFKLQSERNHQSGSYRPGHAAVSYMPGWQFVSRPLVGVSLSTVCIGIDPRLLRSWMAEECSTPPNGLRGVLNGAQIPYWQVLDIPPEAHAIINQIAACPYRGALKRLYLEAKSLELITCSIAPLTGPALKHDVAIDRRDEDCIREAELFLKDNLEYPPSLPDLARRVGVNKNKLNQGFRKIFGTSVFDHLRILRLERARELLENERKSVTEVAFDVGYAHRENFTRAYKKHFHTSPKDHLR